MAITQKQRCDEIARKLVNLFSTKPSTIRIDPAKLSAMIDAELSKTEEQIKAEALAKLTPLEKAVLLPTN